MSKDGNLFINKINKAINNNESIYYSNNTVEKGDIKKDTRNIYQKINDIFTSRNYIYKADVIITTRSGDISKRVIGRNKNHLITSENELISISDILDIKRKEKNS